MAIAVDASTPARVTAASTAATTASFSPPICLLVACTSFDQSSGGAPTSAITNTGPALTWVQIGLANPSTTGNASVSGGAAMHYAVVAAAPGSMTVTGTMTGATTPMSIKVYVLTGTALSAPITANAGIGASTLNDATTTAFTSTSSSSLFMVSATEWTAPGTAPTSSNTTADTYTNSTNLDGLSGYRAISSIASQTADLHCAGTSAAQWSWVVAEILPAVIATRRSIRMIGQAVNRASIY